MEFQNFYLKCLQFIVHTVAKNAGIPSQAKVDIPTRSEGNRPQEVLRGKNTCIPCSIDHTSAACGELNESLRFARRVGIANSEVHWGIAKAEEELNTMERGDLAAEKIAQLPAKQRELVSWLAAQSKSLRDNLKEIHTVSDLEKVTSDMCAIRLQFRVKSLGLPDEVAEISRKAETHEISSTEARDKIKELISTQKK